MFLKKEKKPTDEKKNVFGAVVKYITAALVVLVLFWFGFVCQVREGDCAVILRFGAVRGIFHAAPARPRPAR
jgi:hypothetical protein